LAVLKFFKVDESGKISRLRRDCPTCGAGTFMAQHADRQYCGKCGLHLIFKEQTGKAATKATPKKKAAPAEEAAPAAAPAKAKPKEEKKEEKGGKKEEPKKEEKGGKKDEGKKDEKGGKKEEPKKDDKAAKGGKKK